MFKVRVEFKGYTAKIFENIIDVSTNTGNIILTLSKTDKIVLPESNVLFYWIVEQPMKIDEIKKELSSGVKYKSAKGPVASEDDEEDMRIDA